MSLLGLFKKFVGTASSNNTVKSEVQDASSWPVLLTTRIEQVEPNYSMSTCMPLVGTVESVCPYCGVILSKRPQRKTKCKDCGNYIYVRTRPSDHQSVLITEQEIEIIEEQWSIVNGTHEEFLAEKQLVADTRARLTQQFGQAPSESDVKWAVLNHKSLEYARSSNWGSYRNTKFEMGEHLKREKRSEQALEFYLEVFYLDINGPQNTGGDRELPAWSPKDAILAPGVIDRIYALSSDLELSDQELKTRFFRIAEMHCAALRLPVPPTTAWRKLGKANAP